MIKLGHEETDWSIPCSETKDDARPKRTVYPEIRMESDDKLPKLPEGEFYFIARGKCTGYREPPNGTRYMREVSVLEMAPIGDDEAKAIVDTLSDGDEPETESPLRAELKRIRSR